MPVRLTMDEEKCACVMKISEQINQTKVKETGERTRNAKIVCLKCTNALA